MSSMDDMLSSLPEDIHSRILSLMPTKFAVRTSILSKRWRYSWTLVTNLDFDDTHTTHGFYRLTRFVDQVLKFCKTSQVKLFRLRFSKIRVTKSSVSKWINEAVRLNVCELDIQLVMRLRLPSSLFTCKTLTKLRIDSENCNSDVWECLCPVYLPCLKTLDITDYDGSDLNVFKLISGCPVLESLSLDVTWYNDEDYIFHIPTLKRLKLSWRHSSHLDNRAVLHVPNLEYLYVGGLLCSNFVIEDVSSLVKASVLLCCIRSDQQWFKHLNGLSGVKSLSMNEISIYALFNILPTSRLPIFPNMKHLKLKRCSHFGMIPDFLKSSPELEHLYIEKQMDASSCWIEPKLVPACMLTKLTTIKFSMFEWWKYDMPFLEYMLGNAKVLKTVTIIWEYSSIKEEETHLCAELFKLPRASRCCEVHFRGNWLSSSSSSVSILK